MSSSRELKRGSPNWEMESKGFKNTCEKQTWQLKENHKCVWWNSIGDPEINPYIIAQLVFNQDIKVN